MGADCTKCVGGHRQGDLLQNDPYDSQPIDTASLQNINLPELIFHGMFRKFKLKNLTANETYGVRIIIDQSEQLILPLKNADEKGHIKWQIEEKFVMNCTEYQLRKKYLELEILKPQKIGGIKINFYLISTGPYHLDFEIPCTSNKTSRISFDIKIAQVVSIKIEPEVVEMSNIKQFVGDQFAYSIKTIIGNHPIIQSLSNIHQVKPENKDKIGASTTGVIWDKKKNAQMPLIQSNVPFYEYHYATLKFIFWRIDKLGKNKQFKKCTQEHQNLAEQEVGEVFGQCYVSFIKLLGFDSKMITRGNRQFQVKKIQLSQKLWNHGNQCGIIKVKLNFEVQKHIKQMLVCVRTEKGISRTSPVFKGAVAKSKSNCKQILEIIKLLDQMALSQFQIQKKKKDRLYNRREHIRSIQKCLGQLLQLLMASSKQTIKFFNYVNERQLLKGQSVLLNLGNRIIKYMNEQYEFIENLKWKVLCQLIKRGEFKLNYIGFNTSEVMVTSEILQKKQSIALKYQEFLYSLLSLTFKVLSIKRYDQQRQFAQLFCAVGYFTIPQFRKKLLELIQKQDDPKIEEWRSTDFSLNESNAQFKTYLPGQNTFQILFDWEEYFYKHISDHPKYLLNISHLNEIIEQTDWQVRISKRRGAFFAFIKQWVAYVQRTSIRIIHSNWKHFPGYINILRSFLVQIKLKPIMEYPTSIKLACHSLLGNETLLNIFITIIFKKTNINHNMDVLKILQLLNIFFNALKDRNKRISSTFNYTFFFKGIKMILENQYSFTTAKTLYVLYEHFDLFSLQFKLELINYLLGSNFFNMFLHWSQNVRMIFQHILIIKIYHFFNDEVIKKSLAASKDCLNSLVQRYNNLLIILENAKKSKTKQYNSLNDQDLHKKLKKNLIKKKRSKINQKDELISINNSYKSASLSRQVSYNYDLQQPQKAYSNKKLVPEERKQQNFGSQIISRDIMFAIEDTKKSKKSQKDEVIRKPRKSISQSVSQTQIKIKQDVFEIAETRKILMTLNTAQQLSMPQLTDSNMKYIIISMKQFQITSKQYLKSLKQLKEAPKMKVQFTLDSGQMRPADYGQIQEW